MAKTPQADPQVPAVDHPDPPDTLLPNPLDKTVPGGRYITNGKLHNAHGQLLNDDGTLKDPNSVPQGTDGGTPPAINTVPSKVPGPPRPPGT